MNIKPLASTILVVLVAQSICCNIPASPLPGRSTPSQESTVMITIDNNGGEIKLPDGAKLVVNPGSLLAGSKITLTKLENNIDLPADPVITDISSIYDINLGSSTVNAPLTIEIPIDEQKLPEGATIENAFITYFDDALGKWVFVGGDVNASEKTISASIDHASTWKVSTWNGEAWIAILNKILSATFVDWAEAGSLLVTECQTLGQNIKVEPKYYPIFVQGCIQTDDPQYPKLMLINPKSFHFEVMPISGGNNYPPQTLLSPGERVEFNANTDDPSPLEIAAVITEKSARYLVVDMVLSMLPIFYHVEIEDRNLACLVEKVHDIHYFSDAAVALADDLDDPGVRGGASAAESIIGFLRDRGAVDRFVTGAYECGYEPVKTFSFKFFEILGASTNAIISAVDQWVNFLGSYQGISVVNFIWNTSKLMPSEKMVWRMPEEYFTVATFNLPQLLELMEQRNAHPDAIAIAKYLNDGNYVYDFAETGTVDMIVLANAGSMHVGASFDFAFINPKLEIIRGNEYFYASNYDQTAEFQRLKQKYPKMHYWYDDKFEMEVELPEGGQRFIYKFFFRDPGYRIVELRIAYDFDVNGKFVGSSMISATEIPQTNEGNAVIPSETALPVPTNSSVTIKSTSTPSYSCQDVDKVQLGYGEFGKISFSEVNLRSSPEVPDDYYKNIVAVLEKNDRFIVIGGPICSNDGTWWEIKTESGFTGWVREYTSSNGYLIMPLK